MFVVTKTSLRGFSITKLFKFYVKLTTKIINVLFSKALYFCKIKLNRTTYSHYNVVSMLASHKGLNNFGLVFRITFICHTEYRFRCIHKKNLAYP